ncbi:hypothetical protein JTE90_018738 [Oedothorax gibbosus]|uniref:MADF domain-containing protein n=1 Tax=Oedothorax gibbosus TaxID=931172 RepID=A0AAV6TIB2_9ARAC|nr:hypothetical protein JTE90_018738 [Oedothorax gibbosus]
MSVSNKDFVISYCLWKTSDSDYHNKVKRNLVLQSLVDLFKTVDPTATKDVVLKKLNSMRGSFRKELNKVRASEWSGTGVDDVHVPKLWYYDKMLFLEEQEIPRLSVSIRSVLDEMPFGIDETDNDDTSDTASQASSNSTTPRPGGFKRPRSKADHVLEKISKRIDKPAEKHAPKLQFSSFGDHVAEKLRSMPPEMTPVCHKLIGDVLFYGEMQNLNMTSRIGTDYISHRPTVPPNPSTPSEEVTVSSNPIMRP